MSTPVDELKTLNLKSANDGTVINESEIDRLKVDTTYNDGDNARGSPPARTPSARREQASRLDDDLLLLQAERVVSRSSHGAEGQGERHSMSRTRSRRSEVLDEFDEATNPLHEKAAIYKPPEKPSTTVALFIKKVHESSFIVRYVTYILPVVLLLLIPLLVGSLRYPGANVGGVRLMWFAIWLEIVWLTLWAGRIVGKCLPPVIGLAASIFTNNSKKWRDMARQLELHAALFFWGLGVEISFLPTLINHHVDGNTTPKEWEGTVNKLIIVAFVWTILNLIEKIIIQLIAISFHMRTYADRIEINKFQIGSLTKLYDWSRNRIAERDEEFEEKRPESPSGTKTPLHYAGKAHRAAQGVLNKVGNKVGDLAGAVAADFTGHKVNRSSDPYQVILTLLRTTSGGQVLARRLYRTFARDGFETVFEGDLKEAFENNEEAEAAFAMFDRDLNGDISMEELEAACVEVGRERKSITASLKDLDSVVSKLDSVLAFFVFIIVVIVFLTLISTSAAGVLTSAGGTVLALSWLFTATAQEFLQSVVFVFVKHPFDVGDRVRVYGMTGDLLLGDDYIVKEITLLYTEFKKLAGHVVQAPNSYLNTLFILNMRRSGALAEAVPIIIKYGTTIEQMEALRQRLVEFVRSEKRDFQDNILTELREVTENFSVTLNVVFFYKSNWQNEGLRLQRRNKFICMLMTALQEIGIEGPRMNLQGAGYDIPFHIHYNGQPTSTPAGRTDDSRVVEETPIEDESATLPENTGTSSAVRHPSILRKGMDTATARARGPSTSQHKHVDFSLGMSDLSSKDIMGDVWEDETARLDSIVRTANRDATERRVEGIEEEEERRSRLSTRQPSNTGTPAHDDAHSFRSGQSGRFFRHRSSVGQDRDDLMEQGRSDAPTSTGTDSGA